MKKMKIEKIMTKKILILTLSLLTINLVLKAQVELISGGTGAAFTLNVPGVFSLRNGIQVTFKAHDNSAVGATIDVNVTGAISIMKDGGTNALSASDIKAGQIVTLVFDGSNWQMMNPVATPPAAPTTYWSPNGSDIYNNNGGNVTVNADNSDGAYKMAIGKNASSVEKVLALTNTNNFVGGGTTFGFRSNFGGTLWDQASISGITGALSASGDLAFSVMQNRGTSTMIEAMRIKGNTGRIGIMTPNPDRTLHVLGDGLKIENAGTNLEIYPNGNEFMISTTKQYLSFAGNGGATAMYMDDGNITVNLPLTIQDGSQASGRVLASDASGNASWTDLSALSSGSTAWTRSTPNIYPTTLTDNVGIGLSNPISKVQIHSISGAGNFRLTSAGTGLSATDGFSMSNDGSTEMFMTQHENANWYFATNGGTTAMTIAPSANVGIGTTNPSLFKLHVESSTNRRSGYFFNNLSAANIVNNEIMGIYGGAMGTGASDKIGGFFETSGGSGINYGVYGQAMGGATNWAGYFAGGNVYIQNQLNVGTTTAGTNVNVSSAATGGTGLQMENTSAGGKRYRIISTGSGSVGGAGLFQIYDFDNSAARLTINGSGNVGIGTTTPGMIAGATNYITISSTGPYAAGSIAAIELKGNTNAANSVAARLDFLNGLGTNNTARIEVTTSGVSVGEGRMLFYTNGGSLTEKMRIDEDGNVGIGTTAPTALLSVNGTANKPGGGSWAVFSDARSKENVIDYKKGLNELLKLRPVSFNYKSEFNWGNKTYVGLIAQEVEKVVPTMVEEKEINGIKDFKEVDPNEINYMLINAIKEQQKMIDDLKKEVELLKNK
ncbi:MAG: hypothetical protein F9K09_03775 [Flavobacteriales bacterium]|nr:MAG: hypothetical protein F9K09_03775 [Flavobacteriales bacterium]